MLSFQKYVLTQPLRLKVFYVHFWTNTFGEDMNFLIFPAMD